MSKQFLFIANCWLIVTVLLGILALSGCFFVPDGGGNHGHDDDHHDDRGPPHGQDDHNDYQH
jgi:hypothetical protein